jgi:cytochrome b6-f complex iron-sulfur subunit
MSDSKTPPPGPEPGAAKPVITRRDFLNEVSAGALGIAGLGSTVVMYQYFLPDVLFEPPSSFRAGKPDLFPVNSVSFILEQQVYIVRMPEGFYAVSAVCTHLGCITQWKPEDNLIECPCHGSKFKQDGEKVEGPAPRPLPHLSITLTADGDLLVDKLQEVMPSQPPLKV